MNKSKTLKKVDKKINNNKKMKIKNIKKNRDERGSTG